MVIKIKTLKEIYTDMKNYFYNKTKIDVGKGTIMDMFFLSVADQLEKAHETIEENKKPYIFTNQTGEDLDSTGSFVQCPRLENEDDENYLYRLLKWNLRHASCNSTAIDEKCKELKYSKAANYVQYTKGVGTATIYLIPLTYNEEDIKLAIEEARDVVSTVINPSSRVEFQIPDPIAVKLVAYLDVKEGADKESIKREISEKVQNYINAIAPGDNMFLGTINNLGLNVDGVQYFNVVQIYLDDEEATDFEILQTIKAKFLFNQVIWWDIES